MSYCNRQVRFPVQEMGYGGQQVGYGGHQGGYGGQQVGCGGQQMGYYGNQQMGLQPSYYSQGQLDWVIIRYSIQPG